MARGLYVAQSRQPGLDSVRKKSRCKPPTFPILSEVRLVTLNGPSLPFLPCTWQRHWHVHLSPAAGAMGSHGSTGILPATCRQAARGVCPAQFAADTQFCTRELFALHLATNHPTYVFFLEGTSF